MVPNPANQRLYIQMPSCVDLHIENLADDLRGLPVNLVY